MYVSTRNNDSHQRKINPFTGKNGLYNTCILLWIRGVKTGVEVELLSETNVMKSSAIRTSLAHRANQDQGRKKLILFCLFIALAIFAIL